MLYEVPDASRDRMAKSANTFSAGMTSTQVLAVAAQYAQFQRSSTSSTTYTSTTSTAAIRANRDRIKNMYMNEQLLAVEQPHDLSALFTNPIRHMTRLKQEQDTVLRRLPNRSAADVAYLSGYPYVPAPAPLVIVSMESRDRVGVGGTDNTDASFTTPYNTVTDTGVMEYLLTQLDPSTCAMVALTTDQRSITVTDLCIQETNTINSIHKFDGNPSEAPAYYLDLCSKMARYPFNANECMRIMFDTLTPGPRSWLTSVVAEISGLATDELSKLALLLGKFKEHYMGPGRGMLYKREISQLKMGLPASEATLTLHFQTFIELNLAAFACGHPLSITEQLHAFRTSLPISLQVYIGTAFNTMLMVDELFQAAIEAVRVIPTRTVVSRDPADRVEMYAAPTRQFTRGKAINRSLSCFYCGGKGHGARFCQIRLGGGSSTGVGKKKYYEWSARLESQEAYDDFMKRQNLLLEKGSSAASSTSSRSSSHSSRFRTRPLDDTVLRATTAVTSATQTDNESDFIHILECGHVDITIVNQGGEHERCRQQCSLHSTVTDNDRATHSASDSITCSTASHYDGAGMSLDNGEQTAASTPDIASSTTFIDTDPTHIFDCGHVNTTQVSRGAEQHRQGMLSYSAVTHGDSSPTHTQSLTSYHGGRSPIVMMTPKNTPTLHHEAADHVNRGIGAGGTDADSCSSMVEQQQRISSDPDSVTESLVHANKQRSATVTPTATTTTHVRSNPSRVDNNGVTHLSITLCCTDEARATTAASLTPAVVSQTAHVTAFRYDMSVSKWMEHARSSLELCRGETCVPPTHSASSCVNVTSLCGTETLAVEFDFDHCSISVRPFLSTMCDADDLAAELHETFCRPVATTTVDHTHTLIDLGPGSSNTYRTRKKCEIRDRGPSGHIHRVFSTDRREIDVIGESDTTVTTSITTQSNEKSADSLKATPRPTHSPLSTLQRDRTATSPTLISHSSPTSTHRCRMVSDSSEESDECRFKTTEREKQCGVGIRVCMNSACDTQPPHLQSFSARHAPSLNPLTYSSDIVSVVLIASLPPRHRVYVCYIIGFIVVGRHDEVLHTHQQTHPHSTTSECTKYELTVTVCIYLTNNTSASSSTLPDRVRILGIAHLLKMVPTQQFQHRHKSEFKLADRGMRSMRALSMTVSVHIAYGTSTASSTCPRSVDTFSGGWFVELVQQHGTLHTQAHTCTHGARMRGIVTVDTVTMSVYIVCDIWRASHVFTHRAHTNLTAYFVAVGQQHRFVSRCTHTGAKTRERTECHNVFVNNSAIMIDISIALTALAYRVHILSGGHLVKLTLQHTVLQHCTQKHDETEGETKGLNTLNRYSNIVGVGSLVALCPRDRVMVFNIVCIIKFGRHDQVAQQHQNGCSQRDKGTTSVKSTKVYVYILYNTSAASSPSPYRAHTHLVVYFLVVVQQYRFVSRCAYTHTSTETVSRTETSRSLTESVYITYDTSATSWPSPHRANIYLVAHLFVVVQQYRFLLPSTHSHVNTADRCQIIMCDMSVASSSFCHRVSTCHVESQLGEHGYILTQQREMREEAQKVAHACSECEERLCEERRHHLCKCVVVMGSVRTMWLRVQIRLTAYLHFVHRNGVFRR